MTDIKTIRRIAIVGTGVIGASWTAQFLAKGLQVVATDIAPGAEIALRKFVKAAWPALERLGLSPGASQSNLKFTADLAEALAGADLVQENGPERLDFKQKLYEQLDELLPPDVIIASSSSGIKMSEIQTGAASHPERCVIGHPFNPPHLIPLVEVVGGAKTSEETIQRAIEFYKSIGKKAIRLNKEMPGHVANRLQGALAREVYYLIAEDVLSAADVDDALSWGPGLRWGIMGNMMLNHLGGGPGGIEHFFQQFAGPMTTSWKSLGSPVLTPEIQKKLVDGVHAEVGSRTIEELEAERDEILLGLLELRAKRAEIVSRYSSSRVADGGPVSTMVRRRRALIIFVNAGRKHAHAHYHNAGWRRDFLQRLGKRAADRVQPWMAAVIRRLGRADAVLPQSWVPRHRP